MGCECYAVLDELICVIMLCVMLCSDCIMCYIEINDVGYLTDIKSWLANPF